MACRYTYKGKTYSPDQFIDMLTRERMSTPAMPFKTSWPLLAFKRMIRYAAENGFDKIAWTTGEMQAERYDLSKQIDAIHYTKNEDDTFNLTIEQGGSTLRDDNNNLKSIPENKLEDYVGKDVAKKIINGEGQSLASLGYEDHSDPKKPVPSKGMKLSGLDLKVGGEGMKAFYDKILPSEVNKYVKKWGARTGEADFGDFKARSIDVTDSMREAAMQGQPLFKRSKSSQSGLSVQAVEDIIAPFRKKWRGLDIKVVEKESDLPGHERRLNAAIDNLLYAQDAYLADGSANNAEQVQAAMGALNSIRRGSAAGMHQGKTVYLVAANLQNATRVQRILAHEAVGHYSFEEMMGDELAPILKQIAFMEKAGNKRIIDIAKHVDATQPGLSDSSRAREIIATMAERGVHSSLMVRIKAAIQRFLRKLGFNIALNDADIASLLRVAELRLSGPISSITGVNEAYSRGSEAKGNGDNIGSMSRKEGSGDNLTDKNPKPDGEVYLHGSRDGNLRLSDDGGNHYGAIFLTKDNDFALFYANQNPSNIYRFVVANNARILDLHDTNEVENFADALIADAEFRDELLRDDLYGGEDEFRQHLIESLDGQDIQEHTDFESNIFQRVLYELGYDAVSSNNEMVVINKGILTANPNPSQRTQGADDGMFSRSGGEATDWQMPEPSKLDNFLYEIQDKQIDTKRVIQAIVKQEGQIADHWDAYMHEALYHGRAAKRVQDFLTDELEPLTIAMSKAKVTMEQFNEYLHARHAEERNRVMKERNPESENNEDLSGMSNEDADNILKAADPIMEELAKQVDAIIAKSRQMLVDYGLETQETVDAWASEYAHYVPLQREGFEDSVKGTGTGSGFSVRGKSVKHATGSHRAVDNIFANIAMQREKFIVRGEKNRVSTSLLGLVKLNPNEGFWKIDKPTAITQINPETGLEETIPGDTSEYNVPRVKTLQHDVYHWAVSIKGEQVGTFKTKGEALEYINQEGLKGAAAGKLLKPYVESKVVERVDPTYKGRNNVINVRVKGQDRAIIFNEHDPRALRMAEALKNLDADQLGHIVGSIGAVTRYIAAINTQYNPVFGVINLIRDVQGAALNLQSTELKDNKAAVMKETLGALKGIYQDARAVRKGKHPTSKFAELWEEFQSTGGQTGYRDMFRTSQDRADAIQHMLDPAWWQKTKLGKIITIGGILAKPEQFIFDKVGKHIFRWLSDYNLAMENAVRLAAYKVGKEKGMSRERAAFLAKNLTVNFNKKGRLTTQAGALYAFFNASVQGSARIVETLSHDAKPGSVLGKAGKAVIYGGVTLGAMQAVALMLAGFDDDEPPEFIRERNLIIPTGWTGVGSEKGYISIPMPLGFHVFPNIGRALVESIVYGKPVDRTIDLMMTTIEAFNPIGTGASLAQSISPTIADPIVSLSENKDWTGKPIYREDFNSLNPTPGFDRAKDSAFFLSRYLAYGINAATGGTDYTPGRFSPTPDQIDYLIGQATGGVGRELGKLMTTTESLAMQGELPATYKIPLAGRLVGSSDDKSAARDKFYDNLRTLNMHQAELEGRQANHEPTDVYIKDHPEARLFKIAGKVESDIRKMKKQRQILIEQGNLGQAKMIENQINLMMKRFNESVKQAQKAQTGR